MRTEAPDEPFVLGDVRVLKALAHPLRIRLLVELSEPRTVKETARALEVPPTRLYYHVRILERAGLIRVMETRMVSGIEERTYRAVARDWSPSPTLPASTLAASGVIEALLGMVGAELEVVLRDDPDGAVGDPSGPLPGLGLNLLALRPEDVVELQRRVDAAVDEFTAEAAGDADGDSRPYHLLLALYPRPGTGWSGG